MMSGFALNDSNHKREWGKMKQSDKALIIIELSYFGVY